jgi:hypothetical protein
MKMFRRMCRRISIRLQTVGFVERLGRGTAEEFQPYLAPSPIPFDHIVDFDRKIRAQINAAIVKDFIWLKQEDDNQTTRGRP